MEDYIRELAKVDNILTELTSRYPENTEVWKGSVSERLRKLTDLMIKELKNDRE